MTEDLAALALKAESAVSSGDWATAAAGFEELVRSHPDQADLRLKLARVYEEQGRVHDVAEVLNDPSVAALEQAKRRLASTYMKAKMYVAAMPVIDELLKLYPDDPKLAGWKSRCEKKTSASLGARIELGESLVAGDRLQDAEKAYLALLRDFPDAPRPYLHLGLIYLRQDRWADAVPVLQSGLALQPDNIKIRRSLALGLFKGGAPADALDVLHHGADLENDVQSAHLRLRCHVELNDWARTEDVATKLLTLLGPDDPLYDQVLNIRHEAQVRIGLARADAIAKSGNAEKTIAAYREVSGRHPQATLAWLGLGTALAGAGQDEDATVALRNSLCLDPSNLDARKALTQVIIRSSEERQILDYVREAAESGGADLDCHRWLARYHADRGEWLLGLESARKALVVEPEHASVRILAARALIHLDRLAEALDDLDLLLLQGAKRVEALQLKADVFVRLGRLDDAIGLYREALEASPKHPLISYRLSSALLMNGDIGGFHRFHEKRRELPEFSEAESARPFSAWNGELAIEGKLLVWTEPSLGLAQNIMHLAFVNQVVRLGMDIVLQVEPPLAAICARSFPHVTVVKDDAVLPEGISHQTPAGSLSRWFKPDLASFDTMQPYLVPDAQAVAAHRKRLQQLAGEGRILVGLSLAGEDRIPPDGIVGALELDRVALVNLHDGSHPGASAIEGLLASGIDNSGDLDQRAAVIAALDLAICIDNPTAHLAGATGTPTHVLLPAVPAPCWLARGERSIWYPATRLLRQAPLDRGWDEVLADLGKAARQFSQGEGVKTAGSRTHDLSPAEIRDAVSAFVAQGAFAQGAYRSALELIARLPPEQMGGDMQLQRADLLVRFGEFEKARAVLSALATGEGGRVERDERILAVSLAMYELQEALPLARSLSDLEPSYRLVTANILYHLRRHDEALRELRALSLEAPQTDGLSSLAGTILLELGELERAEAYLAAQACASRKVEDFTLLGRSIAKQGRYENAVVAYDKGLATSGDDPAANFWRTQARIRLGTCDAVRLPERLGDVPAATAEDTVIFFAADSGFFWRHGLTLIASAARRSPNAACHVHVINPDPGIATAIDSIRCVMPGLRLTYSHEAVDFSGYSDSHLRAYYASVRFVRLAEILAKAPATYLCLDADCIVRDDLSGVAARVRGDVGIRMRFDERSHATVAAGTLILRPTDGAAKFIGRVSDLIRDTLEAREGVWFLDQIALSQALRELGDGQVEIVQLEMAYIDWFFRDDSFIWTGKGPRKSEDSRYVKEASKYRFLEEDDEIARLISVFGQEAGEA